MDFFFQALISDVHRYFDFFRKKLKMKNSGFDCFFEKKFWSYYGLIVDRENFSVRLLGPVPRIGDSWCWMIHQKHPFWKSSVMMNQLTTRFWIRVIDYRTLAGLTKKLQIIKTWNAQYLNTGSFSMESGTVSGYWNQLCN